MAADMERVEAILMENEEKLEKTLRVVHRVATPFRQIVRLRPAVPERDQLEGQRLVLRLKIAEPGRVVDPCGLGDLIDGNFGKGFFSHKPKQ